MAQAAEREASPAGEAPRLALSGGRNILYLDDDEALVSLVTRLMGRKGYRVTGYTSQKETLSALRVDPGGFDLVLTDHNMPGKSGLDVAREVRAIRADLPVAVASGFVDEKLIAEAKHVGVHEVLFKATDVQEYCAVVQRLAHSATDAPKPG